MRLRRDEGRVRKSYISCRQPTPPSPESSWDSLLIPQLSGKNTKQKSQYFRPVPMATRRRYYGAAPRAASARSYNFLGLARMPQTYPCSGSVFVFYPQEVFKSALRVVIIFNILKSLIF